MGFSGPPSEPDVRLSSHPALHEPIADPELHSSGGSQLVPDTQCPPSRADRRYSPAAPGIPDRAGGFAGPLRHVHGFPVLGLLRVLRPTVSASTGNESSRPNLPKRVRGGTDAAVPTFTRGSFDRRGAQLCSCSIATVTPQAFTVASRPANHTNQRVPRTRACGCALLTSPDPSGSSWRTS